MNIMPNDKYFGGVAKVNAEPRWTAVATNPEGTSTIVLALHPDVPHFAVYEVDDLTGNVLYGTERFRNIGEAIVAYHDLGGTVNAPGFDE